MTVCGRTGVPHVHTKEPGPRSLHERPQTRDRGCDERKGHLGLGVALGGGCVEEVFIACHRRGQALEAKSGKRDQSVCKNQPDEQ